MKTSKLLLGFSLLVFLVISCQKEKSFEKGSVHDSSGSLQSAATGDCLGNSVSGVYKADTVLNGTNYVDVQVDVINTGSYLVYTDTINGIYFRAAGSFTSTGVNSVRLLGNGTPTAAGTNIFTVTYDSTQCTFSVSTINGGSGGTSVLTLAGSPNACTGASVQGILTAGVAANSTNTATIQIDVTTAGTYAISTAPVDGISFSASGTFSSTGAQSIDLKATGTPTTEGSFTVPISVGSSSCSFQLTVVAGSPGVYTLSGAPGNCTGATVQGTYTLGTALDLTNTATIQVDVTTPGTYSITTTGVNGITFTGSGIFSTTGTQSIVLMGSGTPTVAGDNVIPITVGSSSCSFDVTVDQGQTGGDFAWQFTVGSVTYQGPSTLASITAIGGGTVFEFLGTNVAGDSSVSISITNPSGSVQSGVNYNTNANTVVSTFLFSDAMSNPIFQADPTKSGVNLVIQLTNIDQTNQIVQGTFSGTVKDKSNVTQTITNGSFKAQLQ